MVEEKQGMSLRGNGKSIPARSTQKPVAIMRQGAGGGGKQQKNEIFVDIVERLTVLFSGQGHVLNSTIDGCIQMKSYLAGNPGPVDTIYLSYSNKTNLSLSLSL